MLSKKTFMRMLEYEHTSSDLEETAKSVEMKVTRVKDSNSNYHFAINYKP